MKLIWYAFNPAEYNRDTAHLSMLEHGAYRLLLDHYYLTGSLLPANAQQLHRICRAFANEEQQAVQVVLQQYFELTPEGWRHERVETELAKTRELSTKRKRAAASSHAKRKNNELPEHASAGASASASASAGASAGHLHSQLQLQVSTSQPRAHEQFAMHPAWQPSDHLADMARQAGVEITPATQQEFIAYWLTVPDRSRKQAEWDKALLQSAQHAKLQAQSMPKDSKPRKTTGGIHHERAQTIAALTGSDDEPERGNRRGQGREPVTVDG